MSALLEAPQKPAEPSEFAHANSNKEALRLARQLYAIRRERDEAFGPMAAVFRDPAWDMLLDLFAATVQGSAVSASSAAIAARIPQTTALRHVDQMVARGLVVRIADAKDRRRSLIQLTPKALQAMRRFLDIVALEGALRG